MKKIPKHKKTLSTELQLILFFLGHAEKPSLTDIDEQEFIRLVKHHRLESILFNASGFDKTILSASLFTKLESLNRKNKMRMMQLTAELISVSKILKQEKIDFVVLKGPSLSQEIYGDYTQRNYRDIDILVSPKNVLKAKIVLESLAYSTKSKFNFLHQLNHKEIKFINKDHKSLIELHHRFFNNKYLLPFSSALLKGKIDVDINSNSVPVLGPAINLLYLCMHAASHNWSRLTWVFDIVAFRKNMSDDNLAEAEQLAKDFGLSHVYKQAVELDLIDFVTISNESHYTLLKRMQFLMGLNSSIKYKGHELLQRAMIPYRYFEKEV